MRWKHVGDTIQSLIGARCVQRREHEVAGLTCLEGDIKGLSVSHLANQDNVRRLAQHMPEGVTERVCVLADLPLDDDALLIRMDKLERILHRDDVNLLVLIDMVDHAGKSR